jgi:hypothetical protein
MEKEKALAILCVGNPFDKYVSDADGSMQRPVEIASIGLKQLRGHCTQEVPKGREQGETQNNGEPPELFCLNVQNFIRFL